VGLAGGKCSGLIGFEMKGMYGFGYDPLFLLPRYKKTFAQLGPAVKHKLSHRFKALQKTRAIVREYFRRPA